MGVDLAEVRKPEYPEKNPRSLIKIDKSRPTCGAQDWIPGRSGGGCFHHNIDLFAIYSLSFTCYRHYIADSTTFSQKYLSKSAKYTESQISLTMFSSNLCSLKDPKPELCISHLGKQAQLNVLIYHQYIN